jgi:hypothetical protein
VHRPQGEGFVPGLETLIARTPLARFVDRTPGEGKQVYTLLFISGEDRGRSAYATVSVPGR